MGQIACLFVYVLLLGKRQTHRRRPTMSEQPLAEDQGQRPSSTNSSSRHSTPNSSAGEKQFQFANQSAPPSTGTERGSGQHSRTSSLAEPLDGFSNYGEIVQHLQSVWSHHHASNEGVRRYPSHSGSVGETTDTGPPPPYSKGHSQSSSYYSHHQPSGGQYWSNYNNNNPRRSAPGHYSRGYGSGTTDQHWTQKGPRYPTHRLMNSANSNYPTNQQSPPSQRRPTDHDPQSYYKKTRANGYGGQQQSATEYSSSHPASNAGGPPDISYASHLNTYNR